MAKKPHEISPELAKERALRIKRLRIALRLSRLKFARKYEKYGLSSSALQNWEDVRWYGLTETGANLLAKVFQEEGLNVTVPYLMYGIGTDPIADTISFPLPENVELLSEQGIIAKELKTFHQYNNNAVDTIITDDALAPCLIPGDYVAGIRYFANDMEKAINYPSIVQTDAGKLLVRVVKAGNDLGRYHLTCTNAQTTIKSILLQDVKLLSAAPIIWIRKPKITK